MSMMFEHCCIQEAFPDISNWDTSNVEDLSYILSEIKSNLPDISKWNTKNVKTIEGLFYKCYSIKSLLDISRWDTLNVENMNDIFAWCESLKSLLIYLNGILQMLNI